MHDLSVFEGLSDERNCGPRRYVEEKIKENENATRGGGGREDEGVINIELSCTEIFSALAATL